MRPRQATNPAVPALRCPAAAPQGPVLNITEEVLTGVAAARDAVVSRPGRRGVHGSAAPAPPVAFRTYCAPSTLPLRYPLPPAQVAVPALSAVANDFIANLTVGLAATRAAARQLPRVSATLLRLEWQSWNVSVVPLYHRVKEYMCAAWGWQLWPFDGLVAGGSEPAGGSHPAFPPPPPAHLAPQLLRAVTKLL